MLLRTQSLQLSPFFYTGNRNLKNTRLMECLRWINTRLIFCYYHWFCEITFQTQELGETQCLKTKSGRKN